MKTISFVEFRDKLIQNFNELAATATHLFEVELDKDVLWNLYLDSFPEGTNPIYRERREHDCSCCKHFIRRIGNAVFIVDNKIKTIWDFDSESKEYQPVIDALDEHIKQFAVTNVYFSDCNLIGTKENYELLKNGDVKTWDHFYLTLPNKYVKRKASIPTIKGDYRAVKDVFKRSLEEISEESVKIVLELIGQGSLYRGNEWKAQLEKLLAYQNEYQTIADEDKNNWLWVKSIEAGAVVGKIKNHSIGTLLVDITEGTELDAAVRKYEQIVAPANYKRPQAIFTKKMLEDAKRTLEDLGYMESLPRRFATVDDITVNNILFSNKNVVRHMTAASNIFEEMEKDVVINPKKFSKVEEVGIDKFLNDILPTVNELEVFVENKHMKNFVSLIAPQNKDAKTMFKWDNAFGWAYTGGLADSDIRKNVEKAGGDVNGVLRFSIQWNDGNYNPNDFDAHCLEADGHHIYFSNKRVRSNCSGMLDVDIISPSYGEPAVENITFSDLSSMKKGAYQFFVHCYSNNGGKNGFKAEIEFDGQIYSFEYNKSLKQGEKVYVADVVFNGTNFEIKEKLPAGSSISSKEVWNLKTNQFVPVTVVMRSPNYWDEQKGIGNEHIFFMLKDCINPEQPRGFFNEFFKEEMNKHKRVLEALGEKLSVVDADHQLSGVGFSTTQRNELIVKVTGQTQRVVKIKF